MAPSHLLPSLRSVVSASVVGIADIPFGRPLRPPLRSGLRGLPRPPCCACRTLTASLRSLPSQTPVGVCSGAPALRAAGPFAGGRCRYAPSPPLSGYPQPPRPASGSAASTGHEPRDRPGGHRLILLRDRAGSSPVLRPGRVPLRAPLTGPRAAVGPPPTPKQKELT